MSDIVWDTAETLVHRATLLESREDAAKLLRAPSVQVSSNTFKKNGFRFITTARLILSDDAVNDEALLQ